MIIRLSIDNVVEMWDIIKYSAAETSGVDKKHIPKYLTGLLHDLMCDKIQCWANLSESREVMGIGLSKIMLKVTGVPYLFLFCTYGFSPSTYQDKMDLMEHLNKFAINTGCGSIVGITDNPMAINVMKKIGMTEKYKIFEKEVK
jgi:hypothetical protein